MAASIELSTQLDVSHRAPYTHDSSAVECFLESKVLFAPGKAANAGGVAVFGLQQAQNAQRLSWSRDEVDRRLREIVSNIHTKCVRCGQKNRCLNYVDGANIAGFEKVGAAMLAYGAV